MGDRIEPDIGTDGIGRCAMECAQHDGKRCLVLGVRAPDGQVCEPWADDMVRLIDRLKTERNAALARHTAAVEERDEARRELETMRDANVRAHTTLLAVMARRDEAQRRLVAVANAELKAMAERDAAVARAERAERIADALAGGTSVDELLASDEVVQALAERAERERDEARAEVVDALNASLAAMAERDRAVARSQRLETEMRRLVLMMAECDSRHAATRRELAEARRVVGDKVLDDEMLAAVRAGEAPPPVIEERHEARAQDRAQPDDNEGSS